MINYLKKALRRRAQKRTFQEYGYRVEKFNIEGIGEVGFAQWQHPFEKPKTVTKAQVEFYNKLAKRGGMIIDIGAHIGDTTVPMGLAVGREGLVLALEPNKYAYKILEKNVEINASRTNIVPVCFAATKDDGEVEFNYSDASFCNGGFLSQIESSRHGHSFKLKVQGRNLQNYLFENFSKELDRLQLVKVDAEGYDKEILKTIPDILDRYRPNLIFECYKRLNTQERHDLFDVVKSHGYRLYYLESFEEYSTKVEIKRSDMTSREHFDILAVHE